MTCPAALLARIRRPFGTVTEEVRFGPVAFSFTRVADPNRVLDEMAAEEDRRERATGLRHKEPLHLPYWAELWDSGGGVADFLVHRFPTELTGRPYSTSGAARGCSAASPPGSGPGSRSPTWKRPPCCSPSTRRPARPHPRSADQLADRPPRPPLRPDRRGRHPLRPHAVAHLEPFWRAHLTATGTVLLGEPGRPTGGMFLDWLNGRGWTVAEHEQVVPTRDRPIRIFHLRQD